MCDDRWEALASLFERRAAERLQETPGDSAAAAIAWCAQRLREAIAEETSKTWLSTTEARELARTHGVGYSLATIQYWCRNAERLGVRVVQAAGGEYRIHRDDIIKRAKDKVRARVA